MEFKNFSESIANQFTEMCKHGKLFRSNLTGNDLWDLYINSFKPENNPVFRDPNSSSNNCNLDKNFIRRYGNVVAINDNYEIVTMFDINLEPTSSYYDSVVAMRSALKSNPIKDIFLETYDELNNLPYEKTNKQQLTYKLGIPSNHKIYTKEEAEKFGVVTEGKVYTFHHFFADLPTAFVDKTGKSIESIMGGFRDAKNVFLRGLTEIPLDTLNLVKDLINQGSLLDGTTHLYKIDEMLPLKREFDSLPTTKRDNWAWVKSYGLPFAKFRNELIGVLCTELAEGVELNTACITWNKRVDPANYMKATAPITQRQIDEARKFVEENGYIESFDRRFATLDDIDVSEIQHVNVGKNEIKTASVFDSVKPSTSTRHKRSQFDKIEEVSIEKFMKDILPTCTSVEVFFENRFQNNLVTLTTANVKDSKKIFKWDNNYSWTYNGNLAGKSLIKEAVKTAGGKVDGVLRFSITWNEDGKDILDFDAHAKEPDGYEIYYGNRGRKTRMTGDLDVDMINPTKLGVENITWLDKSKMGDGIYQFWIHNYNGGKNKGFKAEIEYEGQVFTYQYDKEVKGNQKVADVTLRDGEFSIVHHIDEKETSREIWNLSTNEFHKVNLVCLSPNHWGGNNIGNKHYFFMMDDCKADTKMRSFHNENLNGDLLKHRKVMEILGETNKLEPSGKQLSGLGFNSTIKDEVILKLGGNFKRVVKVTF